MSVIEGSKAKAHRLIQGNVTSNNTIDSSSEGNSLFDDIIVIEESGRLRDELRIITNQEILSDINFEELMQKFHPSLIDNHHSKGMEEFIFARVALLRKRTSIKEGGFFFRYKGVVYYTNKLHTHSDKNTSKRITAFLLNIPLFEEEVVLGEGKIYIPKLKKLSLIYEYVDIIKGGMLETEDQELLEENIIKFIQGTSGWDEECFDDIMKYIRKETGLSKKKFKNVKREILVKFWDENSLTPRVAKGLAKRYQIHIKPLLVRGQIPIILEGGEVSTPLSEVQGNK